MNRTAAWRWCLAAGLIALGCTIGFGLIPGLHACGPTGGLAPILAFELARTPADVATLFGAEPCRSALVTAQRTGLWLDALGFIPSYTAFLCLAAWAADRRAAWVDIVMLLIAGVADQIEGVQLFHILRTLPGDAATLAALFWAVRVKFALLAGVTLSLGSTLLGLRRPMGAALGMAIVCAAAWAIFSLLHDAPAMMLAFTLAWTVLLLAAAIGAFWPQLLVPRLPAPASPSA